MHLISERWMFAWQFDFWSDDSELEISCLFVDDNHFYLYLQGEMIIILKFANISGLLT